MRIQPAEGIQIHFQTKVPDAGMRLQTTDLNFSFCREFVDTLSAAAAEQRGLRVFSEIKAGEDLEKILQKHGVKRPGQGDYPRKFIENEKGKKPRSANSHD